ncbi:hypothetical protein HAX54_016869 [Datura stramonium]|uniref:Uncharacterized protein n=1 Tax=Datura stramonium TaxID=4076 RepID=A0ABS8RJ27_DATST|nr:hypothetical protein [Datura stramonium]
MRFLLEITAELQNILSMAPLNGVDDPDMPYFFKLRCESCDILSKEQCIYMSEYAYHKRNRFNHVIKCKGCKRVGTVTLISGFGTEFTAADSQTYVPLMMFECDGMVPEDYAFNGGWKLTIDSDEVIEVNLVGGNFVGSQEVYGYLQPIVKNINGRFTVKP